MSLEILVKDTYTSAITKEVTLGRTWQKKFNLKADPFFHSNFDSLDWFVDRRDEVVKLTEYFAISEKMIGEGFIVVVGPEGVGRHALFEVVFHSLGKNLEFRERTDEHIEGAINVIYGHSLTQNSPPPKGKIEFVVFSSSRYWATQKSIKDKVIDEIWLKPFQSRDIAKMFEIRFKLSGFQGNIKEIFEEEALMEICKYSQGVPSFAFTIASQSLVQMIKSSLKRVNSKIVRKIVKENGLYSTFHDYPSLSVSIKRVAEVLILNNACTTVETSQYYFKKYEEERKRSTFSRHLNKLVNLNLVDKTEKGRAAFYQPRPSLRLAVDIQEYPWGV